MQMASRNRGNVFGGFESSGMSWARDSSLSKEMLFHDGASLDHPTPTSYSHLAFLSTSASSWRSDSGDRLPTLEQDFCQGYVCCGRNLGDLHSLLEHFEEQHAVAGSPATSTLAQMHTGTGKTALSARALQLAEYSRKKGNSPNPTASATSTSAENAVASATIPSVVEKQEQETFAIDDVDMDLGEDIDENDHDNAATAMPGQSAFDTSVLMPASNRRITNQHRLNNSQSIGRSLDGLSLGSKGTPASPYTAAASANGSNIFGTRRSLSPAHSLSSDGSGPNTPTADDESDFDPSASSSSIAAYANRANLFAPMGCVTPSMLLPAKFNTPSPEIEGISTVDLISPEDVKRMQKKAETPAAADSPAIIMGSDPNVTSLNLTDIGHGQQAFVAPPPTLPSGRTWTAPAAKPYKCPVHGCDKSYKQQNGLKYHRLHGNCNNRLREDSTATEESDGRETFEDKPFGCYVGAGCGKRYKNMNGLRYHYQHSGPHGQIGLQMIAMGTHPAPYGLPRGSRNGSAASSRNVSRASSPVPAKFQPQQFN